MKILPISLPTLCYLVLPGILFLGGCSTDESSASKKDSARIGPKEATLLNADPPQHITMPHLPDTLSFAGEPVPLSREDVREGVEYELVVNTFRHSGTIFILKRIERWRPLIEKTLREQGVPTDFIYLAVAESEFQNTALSYAGAMGMWQFMPATARDYGLHMDADADMRRDPKLATEAASRYLKWAHRQLGSWSLVATSYNKGLSGTKNILKSQGTDNFWDMYLNPETARYMYRLIAFKLILENPKAYGYFLRPEDQYKPYKFKTIKISKETNLIAFAKEHKTTYKELRMLNPWLNNSATYSLRIPGNMSYEIRVPDQKDIPGI